MSIYRLYTGVSELKWQKPMGDSAQQNMEQSSYGYVSENALFPW